jgi:tight adherence protein C
MLDFIQLAEQPYLLYGVILAGSACLIFGIASLFDARLATPPSARRGASMQWMVTNISDKFVPKEEHERDELKTWLLQAGYFAQNAVQIYYAVRVLVAVLLPAAVLFLVPLYVAVVPQLLTLTCLMAALVGFLAPVYVVSKRREIRQRKFSEGLPDVLDLLQVCTESGLGIDMAIMRVGEEVEEPHPLLAEQLQKISSELRAGLERREAIRNFGARTGIDETVSLVNLLVQSDALGTSMAQTLRAFSEDMRAKRMLRAEEQGHKVSAKLTMVLVACFLPAIFAAVLAPAVYTAIKGIHTLAAITP